LKKIWIILLIVAGVAIGVASVGYFFFWEDLRLLFGAAPRGGEKVSGGGKVDLVAEFVAIESGSKSPSTPAAGPAPSAPADAGPEGDGLDLGGEGAGEEAAEEPEEPEEKPKPPEPKPEPVPTIERKPAGTALEKPSPAKPRVPAPPGSAPPAPQVPASPTPASASVAVQKKAQGLIQRRKYAEAEVVLKQYLAANPQDGDVHFMMGFLLIQQNRKGQAVSHFQFAFQAARDPQIRQLSEQYLKKLR